MRKIATAAAAATILGFMGSFLYPFPPGGGPTPTPVRKVELLVFDTGGHNPSSSLGRGESPAVTPGPIRVGFLIELEPGWHLYWANPGDAGLAPVVRWTLPAGFEAGPLVHPVPAKLIDGDLVSFEHDSPVLLFCDIAPAAGLPHGCPWQASAVLEWMACKESCITGETAVRLAFPPDDAGLRRARELAEAIAIRFPRPLSEGGLSVEEARAGRSGGDWLVEIVLSGPRAGEAVDFYPYPLEGFVIAHSRIVCRDGKITMPLMPSRGSGSPPPAAVAGLVIVDGTGYEISAPVAPRPPAFVIDTQTINPWRSHHE